MNSSGSNSLKFFSSGNIAFVIVVCASYASATTAIVYSRRPVPAWEAVVLVMLGSAYLVMGTYGFAICRRAGSLIAGISYFVIQLLLAVTLILLRGSTGELALILLPLAGQTALLLPLRGMVPFCVLIYVTLVMPLIIRRRWVDAIAMGVIYGTGIVFVVVFTRVAASEREARSELAEATQRL